MNPNNLDRYVYIRRTPTWLVRLVYGLGILVWIPVVYVTIATVRERPLLGFIFLPIIAVLTVHYFSSFGLSMFYTQFDLKKHFSFRKKYWEETSEPSVDVFLPICGEELSVLDNTWKYVSELHYKNKTVYVLDDSKDECAEHALLAQKYGFTYFERPQKGEMKKAGNLKYAFERTGGDFIAIFDADFAPHPKYLHELLPYTKDEKVGIVQSPQYFPTTNDIHDAGPLAFGGARAQELFYRIIQVARDRLGGAHCCGTCAIYRRSALDSIGGYVQIGHSEDAHTGFGLTRGGYTVRYIPIAVSIGLSPDDAHAFFHQQHRWCLGNTMMMLDKNFWTAPVSWKIKFCYITGFLFYIHQPLLIFFSLQLFFVLFYYHDSITLEAGLPYYPHMIWALAFMAFFYIAPLRWGYLYAVLLRMYAYCHAIMTEILGGTVGWIPTNSKRVGVSAAFRQMVWGVGAYTFIFLLCTAFAVRAGAFQLFDYNYYMLEFWILYNLSISCLTLWMLYKTIEREQKKHFLSKGNSARSYLHMWQMKIAGTYLTSALGACLLVIYTPLSVASFFYSNDLPRSSVSIQSNTARADLPEIAMVITNETNALPMSANVFEKNLSLNQNENDVKVLQEFLNEHGYKLGESGAGSLGSETSHFGLRTYRALKLFQRENNLPKTGYFGPATRLKINAIVEKEKTS